MAIEIELKDLGLQGDVMYSIKTVGVDTVSVQLKFGIIDFKQEQLSGTRGYILHIKVNGYQNIKSENVEYSNIYVNVHNLLENLGVTVDVMNSYFGSNLRYTNSALEYYNYNPYTGEEEYRYIDANIKRAIPFEVYHKSYGLKQVAITGIQPDYLGYFKSYDEVTNTLYLSERAGSPIKYVIDMLEHNAIYEEALTAR